LRCPNITVTTAEQRRDKYARERNELPMSYLGDRRFRTGFFGLALMFLVLTTIWGCSSESKEKNTPQRVVLVVVGSVTQKSLPVQLTAIGNVQPSTTVSVRSLVAGKLIGVHFREGQEVKRGDLLFTIDPRPFVLMVKQAEGTLAKDLAHVKQAEADIAKDTAQAKNARVQADRYKSLVERQLIAQEQYDQVRTNAEALEATLLADRAALENAKAAVEADKAALENAKIQLEHCSIRSPIDGRTGSLLVHPGNIVKDNDVATLAVVNQVKPVFVAFSLPEQNLPEIRKYMAGQKLKVEARPPGDERPAEQGILSFIDNAIDQATGTIQLKGTFLNEAQHLWPGQFVNVFLTLTVQSDAVVVPTKAIQTGQQGEHVFVVRPDLTVESRTIVVHRAVNDETIIGKGLKPGETVVTDGQLQLVPGVKVEIKKPASPGAGRRNSG
jgi:membrane fusion protein, multidrug efflux system